jgi:hypothetical protein
MLGGNGTTAQEEAPSPTPAFSFINVEAARVRSAPNETAMSIGTLLRNARPIPYSRDETGAWVLVGYAGGFGWIRRDLAVWVENIDVLPILTADNLTPTPAPITPSPTPRLVTLTPVGSYVNARVNVYVRTGPGLSFVPLGILTPGSVVEPLNIDETNTWVLIRFSHSQTQEGATATQVIDGFGWVTRNVVLWTVDINELPILYDDALTPTITYTPTFTPSATASATSTPTLTASPSATNTDIPTETPTDLPSEMPTATETPSSTNTDSPSETPTDLPSETPTATETPSATNTDIPTETATDLPTTTDIPTETPTDMPTFTPTLSGEATALPILNTETPLPSPTATETSSPTVTNTDSPTETATDLPTNTAIPTETPSPETTALDVPLAISTEIATNTDIPTEMATNTDVPTATLTVTPSPEETAVVEAILADVTEMPTPTDEATAEITEVVALATDRPITPEITNVSVDSPTPSSTIPIEAILAGGALLIILTYVVMYLRGQSAVDRYANGFVVDTCPVCGVGQLESETRIVRLLGIPRPRRTVRCDHCRSLLRETGHRRWRYAVDKLANLAMYDRYNGLEVDERTLQKLADNPIRPSGDE